MVGIVKWFDDSKGYGFIVMEDGREVFCHWSNLLCSGFKTVKAGSVVEFDLYESTGNRYIARNVKVKD